FQHFDGFLVHRQDAGGIEQFLGKGRVGVDHILGNAFGDVPDAFEIGVDLQYGQQEPQVDRDRAKQGENVLAIPVDLELAAVDPLFFQDYLAGEVLVKVYEGHSGFVELGVDQRPHIDGFRLQELQFGFYLCHGYR